MNNFVNRRAPKFTELKLDGGIGVVDEWSQPSVEARAEFQRANGWEATAADYFARAGFDLATRSVPNSGMFVCDPVAHRAFFAAVAERHLEAYLGHPRGFHFEQSAFGYELQQAGLARFLPAAWNRIWPVYRPPVYDALPTGSSSLGTSSRPSGKPISCISQWAATMTWRTSPATDERLQDAGRRLRVQSARQGPPPVRRAEASEAKDAAGRRRRTAR